MNYIGIDVHSKWTTVAGFDPATGELIRHDRVANTAEALGAILAPLGGSLKGMLESGTNAWALYRVLLPWFEELVVVAPNTLWDRRKDTPKTDTQDCLGMAQRLFRGDYTPLYVPDEHTQDLRNLVRAKVRAARHATMLVNELVSLLRSWGLTCPHSLLTQQGRAWVATVTMPGYSQVILQQWLQHLDQVAAMEATLEAAIRAAAADDPTCQLLQTIPGVGAFTALAIRAEIGDIRRFQSAAQLIQYCGLAPRVFQSGERRYYGRLGRQHNHWLRYVLVLFAQRVSRSRQDTGFRRTYWRMVLQHHHPNEAKIVVARQLVRVLFSLWTRGTVWDASRGRLVSSVA
jgi:transposase